MLERMNALNSISVTCPYCGSPDELIVDCTGGSQQYTEDCQVCCRPMVVSVNVSEESEPEVAVGREDD
ncbi:MAG TPA: CPXCG motif-containing cysteine-rich protein [Mariprofundaceae bacterium]|nr:CPXCG motif-containing cysteine-rich protein [Mariprofundaceae bacterium]